MLPPSTPHRIIGEEPKNTTRKVATGWKRIALGFIALIFLGAIIACVIVATKLITQSEMASIQPNVTVELQTSHIFVNATMEFTQSRGMIAVGEIAVVVFDKVGELNNSGGIGWFNSSTNSSGILRIGSDVTLSYLSHYSGSSFLAVNYTIGSFYGIAELTLGSSKLDLAPTTRITPLISIVASNFSWPAIDISMHYPKGSSTLFIAIVDNSSTTWISRARYPEMMVEANSSVPVSSRGYLRFAESTGFVTPTATNITSVILMRPTVATSADDSLALLIPGDLSIVNPPRVGFQFPYLGPTSRASMSPKGDAAIVMGDRTRIIKDRAGGSNYHRYIVYPPTVETTLWTYLPVRYNLELLRDVWFHTSGLWTIEAFENRLTVSDIFIEGTPDVSVKLELGFDASIEAVASAGFSDLFVLAANGSDVIVYKYVLSQRPTILR
ncbi:hypothetical protein BJ742DRAFT_835254 [Cladochytrium replicatum]|nr:hypothetical protein BJ742DRAFT_835254 [Cladochytrium replicatum]